MMYEFTILRVEPENLPQDRARHLRWKYDIDLNDFVVSVDLNSKTIWVNCSVSENDIKKFIDVINFPYYYVNDDDKGMGEFLEYVYRNYGSATFFALIDAHGGRRKREREAIAKERISQLMPAIKNKIKETSVDEMLIYAARSAGNSDGGKTPENIVSYGDECVFILGYLIGNSAVRSDQIGEAVVV